MCQRCENFKAVIRKEIEDSPFKGTTNILAPRLLQFIAMTHTMLRDSMPESAMSDDPYQNVTRFFKLAVAASEAEGASTLKHEPEAADGVVDAKYVDPEEKKLVDEGGDILRDMLGGQGDDKPLPN